MKGLPPAAGKGVRGPEHPSPFSQLVYTSNDSYIVPLGDFKKIHKAACLGQVEKLEKMTERKTINLNIKDSQKRTALHWACVNGHEEVVTFLVDRKCQLDVLDGENRTPLMKALQCHRKACANILIDSGADVNLVDMYGNTALHYAVYSENLSVVAKLLSHGAVIEVQNKASLTPLLLSITKRREQIVEFLLTKNANANAVNRCKCTALMLAVCHGSSEIVGMLLQKNVDVFAADTCGVTAERYAVACGFHHIHQQILEYIQKLSKNRQNTNPEGTSAGTPDEAAPLAERTPDTAESLVEKPPDEAAPLVEGTSDKIQCLEKATSGKFEQSAEETPREITRPAKETSEKFTGRPRKIAWDNKETPVKTGCVARVTSNKTKVLEKGRSKMIACPTKESSTKASTNVDVSSVESIISLFGKTTIEISQSTEVEEDFNLATKGATKTVTGQQENDIGIIEQAPQDLTNKMPTSESGQKEDTKSPSDAEIISKSAAQNYMCLPDAAYQKDIKTINHNIEDQRFSSESEQEEDEENSWDSGSLLGSSAEIQVCIPKSIYQKVMEINRKVEEPPEKPSAFKPATEMQKSVPNKAFELKTEQTLRADQMFPSESKQKDNEENSWDSESLCETVSQKDVCLPKATHQKEIDKISGKLEESPGKDGLLKATCGMKVSIQNKALELKDIQTFKAESPEKPSAFKPATEMQKSVPNKAFELKNEQTLRADEMFPSESKQKDDDNNSWDSESLSETVSQTDVCLPKATHQKEIDKISGKLEESPGKDGLLKPTCGMKVSIQNKALELKDIQTFKAESPEKPSAFKPAIEMQKSVPNKAFELKNEQILRADQMFPSEYKQKDKEENSWDSESLRETVSQKDVYLPKATHQKEIDKISGKLEDSTSLSKILDAVHSGKRARELAYSKMEQMKRSVLKKQLSEAKEIKSQLENQKVKWEQELCSGRLTLNQEEEKRRNADILNEKIREELGRIEEQHRKELEVKQQLEEALRIQDMELKSVRSNSNQVSHPHKNENDLLHENSMLKKEIAMLKLEIATLKHQYQEKENKYFEDIKILKERNAELQMTLKLKEETLTKRASQYSGQLKVLIAENTMLTSKLKEKQDEEILDTEIESYHPRLASAVQDHDQIVTSRKSQELAFHIAGDACLQGRMNVDVNNTIYNNEVLHQPLSETQRESKSLKIINYAGDALRENTLVSEHAQRDQCETQCQVKKAEHMYQNEQDNVNKHTEQQESVEQKLFQLQSKNMWLRQRLVHAHKKADKKSKITINIQFLERKMQHHLLKEKNEEVFNYVNHLKDRIYQYEKEKAEREVIVRKLQKNLADLNKQCVSEASLEVTSRYHINLKDEIQDLMKK
ncbi:ankyrin repeat domain-containing protein 30A-like isoform X3 [Nomascus leucogenys]|uniref:ankyrin repeat domain-containing protein 30A-like isoform X3 n=1 Tax=Nomascus leucogenys TaxID=61853 RepID=UPI00122D8D13|nr:ankyrin repeat domain-containing protein 30A-like isoform X3 [Nomascus leucogenys]